MSLELVKEAVRLNRLIGEDSTQTIVENDIIVPDIKPDIARILLLDGDAWINGAETAAGKVLVNGSVRYKILYISDDPDQLVKSITSTTGFQYALDIPDARQGMQCRVKCDIEHLEYEILNSRKVNVKAIISLSGKATEQTEQYVTRDFAGPEGVQMLRKTVNVNSYLGDCQTECQIRETVDIPTGKPAILEILRNDVKITGKEYRAGEDKIVVRGDLDISTLYIADDEMRSIQFMEHEIPFTQMIDMPGIDETCHSSVDITLGDVSFDADEDGDGELRCMKCDVTLDIYAQCSGTKEIELVDDAYSPNARLNIEKEELVLDEQVSENESQLTIRENIVIDENAPDIAELFNVLGKLSLSSGEITDGRVIIEGVAVCNLLYLAANDEQPVHCIEREIPFRQAVEAKGAVPGMNLDAEMEIEHYSYSIVSAREVEVRLVIGLKAGVSRQMSVPVITTAAEQPLDDKRLDQRPSITIYFAQPDDTLWKIAKRYYTTIEEIIQNNDLDRSEQIEPGSQIIIMKKT
jgi:hypothetical protein